MEHNQFSACKKWLDKPWFLVVPCWPSAGSTKVVGNTVIVKFQ